MITLSKAPALNNLYGTNKWGGKYLKAAGREWKDQAAWLIKAGSPKLTGEVRLEVKLYTCRHQDIDSIFKILLDTIQSSGVISDDYQIFELEVKKYRVKKEEERIELEINSI